jgi:hypothetical protein
MNKNSALTAPQLLVAALSPIAGVAALLLAGAGSLPV